MSEDVSKYNISPGNGRYAALFYRYHSPYSDEFDTPEDAAEMLDDGRHTGQIYAVGIYDTETGAMIADRGSLDNTPTYSWIETVAIEVPFKPVNTPAIEP